MKSRLVLLSGAAIFFFSALTLVSSASTFFFAITGDSDQATKSAVASVLGMFLVVSLTRDKNNDLVGK